MVAFVLDSSQAAGYMLTNTVFANAVPTIMPLVKLREGKLVFFHFWPAQPGHVCTIIGGIIISEHGKEHLTGGTGLSLSVCSSMRSALFPNNVSHPMMMSHAA